MKKSRCGIKLANIFNRLKELKDGFKVDEL
jgi:hypothetical protein